MSAPAKRRGVLRCWGCLGELDIFGSVGAPSRCCGRAMEFIPAGELARESDFFDEVEREEEFFQGLAL